MSITETVIKFNPDGSVESPWWSPDIAEIVCALCDKGGGWQEFGAITPAEFLATDKRKWGECYQCPTRNQYCG